MGTKKITEEELAKLFTFTRRHFVEYYDLQSELVDHLANAIEERWERQPNLTFDEALHLEFKKFGIFGFSDIVEQRQNALFKKYYGLIWYEFRSEISLPVVVMVLIVGFAVYETVLLLPWIFLVLLGTFLIINIYRLWYMRRQYRLRLQETGKKWLLEEVIYNCGGFGMLLCLPLQLVQHITHDAVSPKAAAMMAIVLLLLFVYDYIVLFRLPSRAEIHLRKVYPEYGIENLL